MYQVEGLGRIELIHFDGKYKDEYYWPGETLAQMGFNLYLSEPIKFALDQVDHHVGVDAKGVAYPDCKLRDEKEMIERVPDSIFRLIGRLTALTAEEHIEVFGTESGELYFEILRRDGVKDTTKFTQSLARKMSRYWRDIPKATSPE